MPTRIGVSEIPLEANLEAKKFKHLRSDMGDLYVVFCIDLHTGDEYNLIVTEGLVYDYLEAIRRENNPFRFNIREYWILKAGNTLFQLTRHIIG